VARPARGWPRVCTRGRAARPCSASRGRPRLPRAAPPPDVPPPHAVGLDDFALRKGRSYGTIVVDLERRRPIDLLPDRTADTVAAWLQGAEGIDIVARDRYQEYATASTVGAPAAVQVVDRFHLLVNAREVVERYVHRVRPELRRLLVDDEAADPTVIDAPPPPSYDHGAARRQLQASKHTERERRFRQVKEAHARGLKRARCLGERACAAEWRRPCDALQRGLF